jgi:predicted DNA-binding transcriptional regulator AlpA
MRLFHREIAGMVSRAIRVPFRPSWGKWGVKRKNAMATAPKLVQVSRPPTPREETARLLRAEDVAAITGLSVETLAQWRSQRKGIPFLKLSRNCVRYRQVDLDRWLAERIVRVEVDPSNARRNN